MNDDAPQQEAQHSQDGPRHTLDIVVPAQAMDRRVEAASGAYRQRVRLPGFRQGKAPLSIVRTQFADEIRQHVIDHAIPEAVREELQRLDLTPVGSPQLASVDYTLGADLRFVVRFDVAPTVQLRETQLTATRPQVEVTDEMLGEALDQLRERAGRLVPVADEEGAAEGMYARCQIVLLPNDGKGKKLAEEHRFVAVGDERAIPGLNDELMGRKEGDSGELVTQLAPGYPNAILAGKEVLCRYEITELKRRHLPELDDEMAKEVGFEGLEALREHVRTDLASNLEARAERTLESSLLEQFRDANPVEVPESLVERRLDEFSQRFAQEVMSQGVDPREAVDWTAFRNENRAGAAAAVADEMLLDQLARDEQMEVDDDTVREEIGRQLRNSEGGKTRPVASVIQQMRKDGSYDDLRDTMRRRLALDHLKSHATIELGSGEKPADDGV